MLSSLGPVEVWSKKLNPSELYNMERRAHDHPANGGGQLYIQINQTQFPGLLKFLGLSSPPGLGSTIPISVRNPRAPTALAQTLEFWVKSQNRMRTGPMNRYRGSNTRPNGWSPAAGFPTLPAGQDTNAARTLLNGLGGVRIFLARDPTGAVWAGFTAGSPTTIEASLPYAHLAWAPGTGGYWP